MKGGGGGVGLSVKMLGGVGVNVFEDKRGGVVKSFCNKSHAV